MINKPERLHTGTQCTPKTLGLALLLALGALPAHAVTPLQSVRHSSDITVVLGGVTLADERVAEEQAGLVTALSLGPIPADADLTCYHRFPGGIQIFSLDTTTALPGGITAKPNNLVSYDGVTYSFVGPSVNANIDACAAIGSDLILSFDATTTVGGLTVGDEDLVRFTGAVPSLIFDGSAAGVDPGLDLDAADLIEGNGHLLLSFDGSGALGGVFFNDEDVLEYSPGTGVWEMAYDGSSLHPDWVQGDLDAIDATVVDADGDGRDASFDCNDSDPLTYPGAPEVHDCLDNQCAGSGGFGVIDEISGLLRYANPANRHEISWTAQTGANGYVLVRSNFPTFADCPGCTTTFTDAATTLVVDPGIPVQGAVFFYVVGSTGPQCLGSFGARSSGTERCVDVTQLDYVANPNVAIPDGIPAGVSHAINVGGSFTVGDLNIDLGVAHTYVGDLVVTLTHVPSGTTVTLIDRPGVPASTFGCSSNNYDILLDDEGVGGAIENLCGVDDASPVPTSPPNYTPNNLLSAFRGLDAHGDWRITIADFATPDAGTLQRWSLHFAAPVFSANPVVAIPDNSPVGISSTINVPYSFNVEDLDLALTVPHTWVGDLIVTLRSPSLTTVTLIDRPGVPLLSVNGCPANNYNIVLDDGGTGGTIENLCAPTTSDPVPTSPPNYRPNGLLSAFNGANAQGNWILTISDNALSDLGTLQSWSLRFRNPPCP